MENKDLNIPVILGTAREGRKSEYAANFMLEQAKEVGLNSHLIDVKDYLFEFTKNPKKESLKKEFSRQVKKADGFIIVSPEYNHGYPGELKMMLDALYPEFARKAVGICGVSNGPWGGARMTEQLKQVCITFHMAPINNAVYFKNVDELFDSNGKIKVDSYKESAKGFLEELIWFTSALKEARAKDEE